MSDYLITSFATKGSRYVECMEKQKALWGDRYHGFLFDNHGSWGKNCKMKPQAIKRALGMHDRVLWVDSDCMIDPPDGWPCDLDVGYIHNIHPTHVNRISAGFILFENNPKAMRFLDRWMVAQQHYTTDHGGLVEVIKKSDGRINCVDVSYWLEGRHTINRLLPDRGEFEG